MSAEGEEIEKKCIAQMVGVYDVFMCICELINIQI